MTQLFDGMLLRPGDEVLDKPDLVRIEVDIIILDEIVEHHLARILVGPFSIRSTNKQSEKHGWGEITRGPVQSYRNELVIPNMGERAVSEIVTQTRHLDTSDVAVGNFETRLRHTQSSHHHPREVKNP